MEQLQNEFDYYLENKTELDDKYEGKYIVLKDQKVLGVYYSDLEAVNETAKEHELGTFLVQKCEKGNENYTAMYHSRVVFS